MLTLVTSVGSVLNNSGRMLQVTGCGTCSRCWWCRGSWGWWWCESCTATTFLWSSHLAAGPWNISWTGELKNNLFSTSGLVGRLAWTGHHTGYWMGTSGYWGLESGHWATIHGSGSDMSHDMMRHTACHCWDAGLGHTALVTWSSDMGVHIMRE